MVRRRLVGRTLMVRRRIVTIRPTLDYFQLAREGLARRHFDDAQTRDIRGLPAEFFGSAGEYRKSPKVHRDDELHADQPDGVSGLLRIHRVVTADRQQGDIGFVDVTDDLHVHRRGGVPGVVDPNSVFERQHVTRCFAAVYHGIAVADAATMRSVRHGGLDAGRLDRAALVHADRLGDALFSQPRTGLDDADARALVTLR